MLIIILLIRFYCFIQGPSMFWPNSLNHKVDQNILISDVFYHQVSLYFLWLNKLYCTKDVGQVWKIVANLISKYFWYWKVPVKFSFSEKATIICAIASWFWRLLRNLSHGFDFYLVNIKTMRKFAQIFMAFSTKLNFTGTFHGHKYLLIKFASIFNALTTSFVHFFLIIESKGTLDW